MPRGNKITTKGGQKLTRKLEGAGARVRHVNAKSYNLNREGARNENQSYTAGGRLSQAYDPNTKQFTKGATSTKSGRLAVEGSTNTKGARTWTFTNRDMEGNLISQAGRSQTSDRRQREYDVKKGLNNISPKVIQAWKDNGMLREVEGGGFAGDGVVIRQKPDGTYSMGLTTG